MDWKRCNLRILCAFRFSVYYLRITTKRLTEMAQRPCVVFCTVTENRHPSMVGT